MISLRLASSRMMGIEWSFRIGSDWRLLNRRPSGKHSPTGENPEATGRGEGDMQYRRLGDAGVKLSEIGLGGWLTFGNAIDVQRAAAVMGAAFDRGINFFDTANVYARGRCEEVWGELLKERRRDG